MNSALHVAAFLTGAVGWTFAEYWIHYRLGHVARGRQLFSREHLTHHAKVSYFSPEWMKLLSAVLVMTPMALIGRWLVGNLALSFTAGFGLCYFAYELLHKRAHTHAPRNAYGRMIRRHHFHHHFRSPMKNHGLTTRLWDRVFGTFETVDVIVVPRRVVLPWLLDTRTGDIAEPFRGDYRLGPRRVTEPTTADDHDRAFANTAPVT